MPKRLLITGDFERGKTTLCGEVASLARGAGWSVRGVLSPAVFEGERKVGIDLVDASTGQRRRLAHLAQPADKGLRTTRWGFVEDTVEWGNALLGAATGSGDSIPCDLLIIDELGPLELVRGEGWLNGLKAVNTGAYRLALIVIRPPLLSIALEKWPDAEVIEIPIPEQAIPLASRILKMIPLRKNQA